MDHEDFKSLDEQVISKGLCTACGACVGACPVNCIAWDEDAEAPVLAGECKSCGLCASVCPGEQVPLGELEKRFFGRERTPREEYLGVCRQVLRGYARDGTIRESAASGGVTTALLLWALDKGIIDAAVVAGMDRQRPWCTKPILARTPEEIIAAVGSKYQICPSLCALDQAGPSERLAVVGLACHMHAVRKLMASKLGGKWNERIVFTVGVFCAANTSRKVTEHVIQEMSDFALEDLASLSYRGGKGSQDMVIRAKDGSETTVPNPTRLNIYYWMMRDRCRVCPDWTAELADISTGDIFQPTDTGAWKKTPQWNGFMVRSQKGEDIVTAAQKDAAIACWPLDPKVMYGNIGFEAKKHGAMYNLIQRKRFGWPFPDFGLEPSFKARRRLPHAVDLSE